MLVKCPSHRKYKSIFLKNIKGVWSLFRCNLCLFRQLMTEWGEFPHGRWYHMTHCLVTHLITVYLACVLVPTECISMCLAIGNPASCKTHNLVHLLHTKNMSAGEIHCKLCTHSLQPECYDWKNQCSEMSEQMFTMESEEVGWQSVMGVLSVDQNIYEEWCYTISDILCEVPHI
jgi:hypothetical protein